MRCVTRIRSLSRNQALDGLNMAKFLTEYQTLIVGTIGFLGVMLTIFATAQMNRRQHAREAEHEARIVRTALLVELKLAKEAFESLEIDGGFQGVENFLQEQFDIRLENLLIGKDSSVHHLESGMKNKVIQRKQNVLERISMQYKN